MPSSDQKLLAEIEALYRERFPDFVAVAASIVGERKAARESVQDAFAGIVRSRRGFRGEGPLEAWVWRAVVNAARKKKGRYAREVQLRSSGPVSNGSRPEHEPGSQLAALVAALPERQRLVLFLRYYADLDYKLRLRRVLLPAIVLLVAALAVGSALALTGRLGGLFHGTPVKDLTPNERFILSERVDAKGRVELIATHGSRTFYVIRKHDGGTCYAVGEKRKNLTPAQAELRSRFGAMGCLGKGVFPSQAMPVLDFSYYRLRLGERLPGTLVGLEGFAADPVRKIGVIGPDNDIAYTTDVEHNVYSARSANVAGARGIVALDDDDKPLWVQCQGRRGCGKYKSSPPPVLPPSSRRVPRRGPPQCSPATATVSRSSCAGA